MLLLVLVQSVFICIYPHISCPIVLRSSAVHWHFINFKMSPFSLSGCLIIFCFAFIFAFQWFVCTVFSLYCLVSLNFLNVWLNGINYFGEILNYLKNNYIYLILPAFFFWDISHRNVIPFNWVLHISSTLLCDSILKFFFLSLCIYFCLHIFCQSDIYITIPGFICNQSSIHKSSP